MYLFHMQHAIEDAIHILRRGGLVAIPTETVYGLGADARNSDALRQIFLAKRRPEDHPLIVHIGDVSQLSDWAVDISESALVLAKTFWPGPLTLILKKAPAVLDLVTGNQDSVGVRIPNHPLALQLLNAFGGGIAAPSANRFGRISPTTADAVREELGDAVDMILDGGPCDVGVESTIVDVRGEEPIILRPGMISAKQIADVLKKAPISKKITKDSPRVSGSMQSHYAPETKMRLIESDHLFQFLQELTADDLPIALLVRNKSILEKKDIHCVLMPTDSKEYAHSLYQIWRELDKKKFKQIVIENVPDDIEWDAIRDRLMRASSAN